MSWKTTEKGLRSAKGDIKDLDSLRAKVAPDPVSPQTPEPEDGPFKELDRAINRFIWAAVAFTCAAVFYVAVVIVKMVHG